MNLALNVQTIAVIGAGQMGGGIAQVCAAAGYNVSLCDLDELRCAVARDHIDAALQKAVAKGRTTADSAAETLGRLHTATLQNALTGADLAIEAVTENPELKCALFSQLDDLLPGGALIASNTSSISITRLAACTRRPDRVIGMHFMNPVPVMKLVEVVLGKQTSEQTLHTVRAIAERLSKTVVVSKDSPGFIVNRILIPLLNEACLALQEGVASVEDIDTGIKLGLNHPMGPLELSDLIGLDTVLAIAQVMREGLASDKYHPPMRLQELVAAGHLGRKTGRGFYTYDTQGNKHSGR